MPVGVIKIRKEDNHVEWFNPYAELILPRKTGEFDQKNCAKLSMLVWIWTASMQILQASATLWMWLQPGLFYFFDASTEYKATSNLVGSRPVIGIISVDNYDELEDSLSDSQVSQVNSFGPVCIWICPWAFHLLPSGNHGSLLPLYGLFRFEGLIESKFSLIDKFREEAKQLDLPPDPQYRYGLRGGQHQQIGQLALQKSQYGRGPGGVTRWWSRKMMRQAAYFLWVEALPLLWSGPGPVLGLWWRLFRIN